MKTIDDPAQSRLFDPFEGVIGEMGWKHINGGRQSMFRDVLLEKMPVQRVARDMSDNEGRPSAELYAIVGLIMIRELHGWTVPQTHEAVLFRSDIQYALNLEPGFEITQRTIERYLQKLQNDEGMAEEIFTQVTDTLLQAMEVKVKKQRLDSTHVLSDMAVLGRAQMMGVALRRLLHQLEKHRPEQFEQLPEELKKRYCKQSDSRIFAETNPTEKRRIALQQVAQDMAELITLLGEDRRICEWKSFEHVKTIFAQQCEVREEFVAIREKVGGNVIQNPSDPEATYDGHKGAGYQVQIAETFNEDEEPNFVTSASVETAVKSDADAVNPVLEDLKGRNLLPEELLADATYGSHENVESAKKDDVQLTSPVPGGKAFDPDEVGYDQFEVNDAGEVTACPAGHAPKSSRYNEKNDHTWAQMDASLCGACPLAAHCPLQKDKATGQPTGQPTGRIQFRSDAPEAARRRRHEQTDEFRDCYRWRSGIESVNAALKRRLGLGRLRVRGMKAVKLSVYLKLAAWNLLRGTALRQKRLAAA